MEETCLFIAQFQFVLHRLTDYMNWQDYPIFTLVCKKNDTVCKKNDTRCKK